ncbi:MAG TPA: hypothetical protein VLA19_25230 [Herpetosiphonaceae bacterium]|nr:hypothetical protein [Herpetosiphonaceae bacterium]
MVTLAANPSRKEYLRDAAEQALSKVRQAGNDSLLSYLEPPHNRFRLLGPAEQLSDVLESGQLQDEILAGYDDYFERNPYTTWFGSPRERSYNVEGFLRGLGSSYFGRVASDFQAVHIDLFPLATLSDFSNLRALSDRDLLRTTWARTVIQALLDMLQPIALLIFGRANFDAFGSYIDPSVRHFRHVRYGRAHYFAGVAQAFNVRVIGLSTNLGNPMGFSSESLLAYGRHVREATGYFDSSV